MEYNISFAWGVALCACLFGLIKLVQLYLSRTSLPPGLPRVRDPGRTRFSLKTRLAYYTNCAEIYREAYEKYSKQGKTCVVPGLGLRDEVVLPLSSLQWAVTQPDSVMSVHEAFADMDQAKYNAGSVNYILDPWPGVLVRTDLNRVLEMLMVGLADEVGAAFDRYWGTNTEEWVEVNLYETMQLVVGQASGRFTVGVPLCRDETYIKSSIAFGNLFVLNAGLIGLIPKLLRPIFGPILTLPNRYHEMKIQNCIKDLYKERVANLGNDPKADGEPQDHFQMMLRFAQKNRPSELQLGIIAGRLAVGNFGAIHQTSIAITNIILNIIESEKKFKTISALQDEMKGILQANGGAWTKSSIAKMIKTDSVMRETKRINSFGNRSVLRLVKAKDGVKTPDGHVLPVGSSVSFLAHPVHTDPDIFDEPLSFDPFRFSRLREEREAEPQNQDEPRKSENGAASKQLSALGSANLSFVSTGPTNLPFGHGRTACPGRFLADFELKMILAYMVMNYDIELAPEHKGVRPPSSWVAEAILPPSNCKMRVKRKTAK